jgi:hypothetical protein
MKMKLAIGILGVALALSSNAHNMAAQTETQTQKANTATTETAPSTFRLTYTITDLDGNKQIGVQHFALIVTSGVSIDWVKLGSRVPIITGTYGGGGAQLSDRQFQYVDIGLNIGSRIKEYSTGIEVYSKFEQTAVEETPSNVGTGDPVIRQALLETTSILTLGKPALIGSVDIPKTTRHLDIAVMIESVR